MQTWCVDCLVLSPKTESLYELGAEGWRAVGSAKALEWRCPACWLIFKEVMGEAAASSARFRAAAAIAAGESGIVRRCPEREADNDPTPPDTCEDMIASSLREIFDLLDEVPARTSASRARKLLGRAGELEAVVSGWKAKPPGQEAQIEVFDGISRLHAEVSVLVAAYRRASG